MGKTATVSFEENSVKIVHASLKGKTLSVDKSEVVADIELDYYLQNTKTSDFILTCEFKDAFQGIITIPAVTAKYLEKIVGAEIRKASDGNNLSYIFTPLEERIDENKKVLDVFYYAVKTEDIKSIVSKFYEHGKTVSALYPSVYAAASIMNSANPDDARMGVYSTGKNKISFFVKNEKIHFIRHYESYEAGISDFDIQNINMTISYCYQNIKTKPSSIFLLGDLAETAALENLPSAPLASLSRSPNIVCSEETFLHYVLPLGALYAHKSSNILSKEFKNIYMLKTYITYSTRVFAALIAIFIGIIVFQADDIIETRDAINTVLKTQQDLDAIYSDYSQKKENMQRYMPVIGFLNSSHSNMQNLFATLGASNVKGISYNRIEARADSQDTYSVIISGTIDTITFSSLQSSFDRMINALKNIKDLNIKEKTMDLSSKSFTIEMEYRNPQ